MTWLFEKNNLLRLTGLTAIFGMVIIMYVDIKLLYMPLGMRQYSIFQAALARSREDISFFSRLAVFAIPFVLFGLFHFHLAILKSNKIMAWLIPLIFFLGYISAAFYYAYLTYIMNVAHLLAPFTLKIPYFTEYMYFIFQLLYYGGIIGGSIFLFITISFFKNNYSRHYIWINPLYLIGIFRFILPLAAKPALYGFLMAASFNAIMLITMIFSTVTLWNKPMTEIIPEQPKSETQGL